jgi:Holliday junction resolvase RusA-like endonuclease
MGSKRAYTPAGWTRPIITDSNRNLKSWQQLVTETAAAAILALPVAARTQLTDGVRLTIAAYLPRPKTLPKRQTAHTKAPDLDKLVRGLCDALSQVVYRDDSQMCELVATKHYAPLGVVPYVDVYVGPSTGVGPVAVTVPLFEVPA